MRNRLIVKIVLTYLVLIVAAGPVLWLYLSGVVEGFLTDRIADNLKAESAIIARELPPFEEPGGLDGFAREYKGLIGARVTVIDATGVVLGDSDESSARMENHLYRPEVQEAMRSGWGSAVRFSHTLGKDMLYVAVDLRGIGGHRGFIRLSMPLVQVEEAMSGLAKKVTASALAMLLLASVLGLILSRHITGKISDMVAFTKEVASGNFGKRLRVGSRDELGVLASNLNDMAGQLNEKIDVIAREKATLEAVLGGMVEGVLVTDSEGRVILANRKLRETFGLRKDETLGRPFLEVIRNSELSRLIGLAHERREFVTGEVEVQYPEGLCFMAGCVPLMMKDTFAGVVLVLHDITRLKALERVRRDFVANVTHELKTPISAIQGFSETLLAGAMDEKENARRFLGIIEANSQRLSRLIDDLLTLSKIELGEVKLELRQVSLRNVCSEVAALLQARVAEKRLEFVLDVPETARLIADRDKLYQIVLNLLDNAVKFTPEGGRITLSARESGEGMVELSITDTGSGIPPELLPRIGERFFRVDAARSRELGGTGLGLAIVKHLMKAHGGSFAIESYPMKGTTVALSFKQA